MTDARFEELLDEFRRTCFEEDDETEDAARLALVAYFEEMLAERDAAFAAGAREMTRLVHDEMERCIGKARKAKEITRTARLRCEMGAVVGWIAALQEEMFINPETRLRASLPAQIVDEEDEAQ